MNENFTVFAELSASCGFGHGKTATNYFNSTNGPSVGLVSGGFSFYRFNQHIFSANLSPGVTYLLSKNWGIDLRLGLIGYTPVVAGLPQGDL
ncbi:MAG: hypothetical protein M3512_12150 [Bacteroidota bacterium]|nr:hypothetical protein [Bacteroidota bacterium]